MSKKAIKWSAICINSLLMLLLTLYLLRLPWLAGDEKLLIWTTSALKLNAREIPPSEDFALINTSYDIKLIEKLDDYGFSVGKQAVTDRDKLARLLRILSETNAPKYIICDIHFVDETSDDQSLETELLKFHNIIISSHLDENNQLEYPLFTQINRGLSDYVIGSVFDGVYKYQLIYNDSLKLTPLKVYEYLSKKDAILKGPFIKIGEQWTLNNFIMNYRLLQKDINSIESGFNPVNMGELLLLSNSDIQEFCKNKIVIIGDFLESDMHETLFEITSGPLILLNAYLTIASSDTYVNFWFILILLSAYLWLSYLAFSRTDMIEIWIKKWFGNERLASNFTGFMSYLVQLVILSVFTFFLFNIHINVFFLAIGFFTTERISNLVSKRLKKANF